MAVRPFLLLKPSVLEAVSTCLSKAVHGWCEDWGLEQIDPDIVCSRAWEEADLVASGMQWQHCYSGNGKSLWLALPPEFARYVQRQLFPPDQRHVVQAKNR